MIKFLRCVPTLTLVGVGDTLYPMKNMLILEERDLSLVYQVGSFLQLECLLFFLLFLYNELAIIGDCNFLDKISDFVGK